MTTIVYWVSEIGWFHLLIFGLLIPVLAVRSRRHIVSGRPRPPRIAHYRASVMTLLLFGMLSVLTAQQQGIELFAARLERPALSLAAAAALLFGAVLFMRPRWRRAVERRAPAVYFFSPATAVERVWWVAVAILAGISEEITWRGVQAPLAAGVVHSAAGGAVLSAAMFGAAHATQGIKSAGIIAALALAFQGLAWISGSLVPGMVVHAAYDLVAGLSYGRLVRELGYDAPAFDEPAPPQNQ